jgi:hypothetical protein
LGVAVLATVVSFPIRTTTPTHGLDASWQLGLSLAQTTDLRFGPELVFTYGPLGFLAAPSDAFLAGAVLGLAYAAATCVALWGLLFVCARRWLSAGLAALLVLGASLAAPRTPVPELGALALALLGLRLLEPARRSQVLPVAVAVLLGANAALQLLVKTSVGGFALGVALLVAAARPGWRRSLPLVLVSWAASLVVLWLAAGQRLGDLPDWAPDAAAVASGYADAMALWGLPEAWLVLLGLLALLTWRTVGLAREDLTARWPQVLLLAAASWFFVKAGFVRLDVGHAVIAYVGLAGLLVWFRWQGLLRVVAVGAALVALPWSVAVQARTDGTSVALEDLVDARVDGLDALGGVARQVVDGDHHQELLAEARSVAASQRAISSAVLAALEGRRVHADPVDIAAVWANDMAWQPEPVFQSYSAYEPRLDERNAEALASEGGPDAVLRTEADVDDRFQPWEPPRTQLEVACRFRVAAEDEHWQALLRTDDRCGQPSLLDEVDAAAGEVVDVPEPSDDRHVVVASFSDPRGLIDAVLAAAAKPLHEHVVHVDGVAHRWVPATGGQPHLLHVPPELDGQALPDGGLDVQELRFDEAVTVTFSELPLEVASGGEGP